MKLYICEKPSLARALAQHLGRPVQQNGYYEVGNDCVAWLRGHIMGLKEPEDYNPYLKYWSPRTLPIIPEKFDKKVLINDIMRTIKSLLAKADTVVNVGDPDREGQLLVDEVLIHCKNQKPTQRLFINAMDKVTISRALKSMEDNNSDKNRNLYSAALAREITDWLIGINGTRKFTLDLKELAIIGRVKTPLLGIVSRRNKEIAAFKPIKYYGLQATFKNQLNQSVVATWVPPKDCLGLDEEDRLIDVTYANQCLHKIDKQNAKVVSVKTKRVAQNAPLPFSLSALQRYLGANNHITPSNTLSLAQSLYEKKYITYPRSDSNYIPDSQHPDASVIIENLKSAGDAILCDLAKKANPAIKGRAFNTKKVEAHHAIIPTMEKVDLNNLSDVERKLYLAVAKRYLAQFFPAHEYDETTVTLDCMGETFTAKGKVVVNAGWKAVDSNVEKDNDKDSKALPPLKQNDVLTFVESEITEKETTPPARFTQDTLIGAMTNAYKYVKDPALKEIVKDIKGIGTEATRSTIISQLLEKGMLYEVTNQKKRELYVDSSVEILLDSLPAEITYPDLTALMEMRLDKVAKGELTLDEYMVYPKKDVTNLLETTVTLYQPPDVDCPVCKTGKLKFCRGRYGKFWSCNTGLGGCGASFTDFNYKPVTYKCPKCNKAYMKRRKNKKGKYFWGCGDYPNCNHIIADRTMNAILSTPPVTPSLTD